MDDAPDVVAPEERGTQTFAPAQPMEFGPDTDAGGDRSGPGPGEWDTHLFEAHDEDPPSSPDPDGSDGSDPPLPATFAVSETPRLTPLWSPAKPPAAEEPEDVGEHGWIVATAVLVAVVIAVVVGVAVLWAPRNDGIQPQVSVSGDSSSTVPSTTAPTTLAPSSTVTTVPVAASAVWAPYVAPDRAFRAELPGVPDVGTFPGLSGASSYTVDSAGVLFGVVAAPFAPTDPIAVQAGLVEAATAVLPPGSPLPVGSPVSFPGGVSVLDFSQVAGDRTIIGRAQVANGHRFVLTMTVPASRVDDPTVTSDLVHFRNGFSATV
jgi:hypothetical protein